MATISSVLYSGFNFGLMSRFKLRFKPLTGANKMANGEARNTLVDVSAIFGSEVLLGEE